MSEASKQIPSFDPAEYYDALSDQYAQRANEEDWPRRVDGFIRRALEAKGVTTSGTALDLGAGTGDSIDAIKRYARPSHIDAVDISPGMLKQLGERHHAPLVKPIVAPIQDFVEDCQDSFDIITMMGCADFVPALPDVLHRIPALLNEGGTLAFTYIPEASEEAKETLMQSSLTGKWTKRYAWPPAAIDESLAIGGLKIVDREDNFPGYMHGSETIPYSFVVAIKS